MKSLVYQCDRCGACLAACPLYAVAGRESSVARGKIAVARAILENALPVDAAAKRVMDFCLLCQACSAACPNKVPTDEIMALVRQKIANETGVSFSHRLIGKFLENNMMISVAAAAIAISKKIGADRLFSTSFPLGCREIYQGTVCGPLGQKSDIIANHQVVVGKKVAYFKGCAMKLFFPEVSGSSTRILSRISEVKIPDNVCCGMPHAAHGMEKIAGRLAKRNILAFADADVIVTDCASCGSALKGYGKHFATDLEWAETARLFSKKIMGFSEYLASAGYVPPRREGLTVTYHDPCHLVRGQGIRKEPRMLLRQAGDYRELSKADMCCGGAGTFHLHFPEVSNQILEEKHNNIKNTGAAIVATECPGCLIQLTKGLKGKNYEVRHISQILE